MSYQIPSQNPSSPPNDTNVDQDYEYTPKSEEPTIPQSKHGFKRRAINPQNNNQQSLEINDKDENVLVVEAQRDVFTEGSPRSAELIVDVSEKSGYMGMSYPGGDDSGMFNLRLIINEAKRSEGRLYENEMNYGENEHNDMNIMIQDEEQEIEEDDERERHRFERVPSKIRKTENQGVEIDFTTEDSIEKEGAHYLGQEPKTPTGVNAEGLNHSKSSYLSGPVRYSKMPEEEAATIFEQRRKELLGNLVKKGRRKHLRIFQDNDSNSARAITDLNAHSVKAKPSSPGFVIYNTRNPSLNKPRMESPPPSLKKKEEKEITSTRMSGMMKPNTSARNTKVRAGSSFASNTGAMAEKKESAPLLSSNKPPHVQPKIKASESRNLTNKRPISSREPPSFFKNQKKEEPVTNKVVVHTLKSAKSKERRLNIEDVNDEPRNMRRETPHSHTEIETPLETIETKESAVKQQPSTNSKPYKNKEIWAEIEDLDQQILELEQAKDIEEVKEFEVTEYEVRSGWKKAKRDNPERREDQYDREMMMASESREGASSRNEQGQFLNAWGRNDDNSERRISDRYKLASDDLLIEQDSEARYSNYINKNEGEYEESATKASRFLNEENLKNSSFSQSYRTFSEKRTPHRIEMLYQKAMEKKEQRQIQHENMKREKELAELRKCTFSPDLMRTNRMEFDEDFNTRMQHWQREKERKLEEIGKKKEEKEMSECTFTPSHSLHKSQISRHEADEFYKKNMDWKHKVDGQDSKKRDDYLKLVTLSGEKQRNKQPSMDNRPTMNDSNFLTEQNRFIKTQTLFPATKESSKKPYTSSASTRSYSKKRGEENKTTAQTQPTETSGIKRFTTTKTQKSRTHTAEDDFLKLDHPKNHPEFNESNEILDLLKRVVTKSDRGDGVRSKGTSQSPRRKGKSFNPSQSGTLKFENSQPMTLNSLESTGPVMTRTKNVSSGDVPFLSNENVSTDLKSNAENIVIKNNKYYITKKLKSPSGGKNPAHDIHSADKKEDIPSLTYTLPSRMKSGNKNDTKQMRGFSPKRDQENNHAPPSKLMYHKQKEAPVMTNLFDEQPVDMMKGQRTPLGNREINHNYESPRLKNDTENKEVNPSLERKFMDLINQVSRVTQQLDQIRPPTAGGSAGHGQNESLSTKRRRINFSLY